MRRAFTIWFRLLLVPATTTLFASALAEPILHPGASLSDCRSALLVGIVRCLNPRSNGSTENAVGEAQVDEYLANYGKPPREAVRALLDPTDENIAAWLLRKRAVLSVAGYVAARMTEMEARLRQGLEPLPALPVSKEPALFRMRATLVFGQPSPEAIEALKALQSVVALYPPLDARLIHVIPSARRSFSSISDGSMTVPPPLVAPVDAVDGLSLPSLVIDDLRNGRRLRLSGANITSQQIIDRIVALRGPLDASPSVPPAVTVTP